MAGERVLERGPQLVELAFAPDEDAAREPIERVCLLAPGLLGRRRRPRCDRGERIAHASRARRPVLGRLGEKPHDERFESARHLGVVPGGRDGRRVDVLRDHGDAVVAEERRTARHHLVEHGAEGVEVAARVERPAERLLGRHVGGGPDHHARLREARPVERERQAEIAELRVTVARQPHVARLEIAMHDVPLVGVRERRTDLAREPERALEGQPALLALVAAGRRPSRLP